MSARPARPVSEPAAPATAAVTRPHTPREDADAGFSRAEVLDVEHDV